MITVCIREKGTDLNMLAALTANGIAFEKPEHKNSSEREYSQTWTLDMETKELLKVLCLMSPAHYVTWLNIHVKVYNPRTGKEFSDDMENEAKKYAKTAFINLGIDHPYGLYVLPQKTTGRIAIGINLRGPFYDLPHPYVSCQDVAGYISSFMNIEPTEEFALTVDDILVTIEKYDRIALNTEYVGVALKTQEDFSSDMARAENRITKSENRIAKNEKKIKKIRKNQRAVKRTFPRQINSARKNWMVGPCGILMRTNEDF